ncbi:ABC transporter ATP-binding protein [Geomicrobium sp. JCM 19055]|uniref:ABC transporter ATP-binding protein n=1 Tax=Geomicrobium sp. JCM 19055 TaxID=1460649 RepID=UPI00045ED3EA|nr:ABC transporter ATP-binding protein [Geomicrobium sp. JCM 19055]GAJ97368.1 oligopeptide transport ATP-binding protein OppD [Geomicrobium sp. JCM 19055]
MSLLHVDHFNVTYQSSQKRIQAVRDVSLSLNDQESLGIVGESGSGKSTLAMGMLQMLPSKTTEIRGEVLLQDQEITQLKEKELRKLRWSLFAVVFQKSMNALSPVHKIGTQLNDIYRLKKKCSKKIAKEEVMKRLDLVNLPSSVYHSYPHELSGGMMQRTSIALALLHRPKLLVLDEATTALDVVTQGQILKELKQLEAELGLSRIMITHDLSVVSESCDRVAVMYAGEVVEQGFVRDVLKTPLHPYTLMLTKAIPKGHHKEARIEGQTGKFPDLSEPIQGCIFVNRCEFASQRCHDEKPREKMMPDQRIVACHFVEGGERLYESRHQSERRQKAL